MNAKKDPGAGNARATTGRTVDRDRSSSIASIHQKPDLVKHKIVRYRAYSDRQSTWCILGPMLTVAGRLGLGDLADDLLELGRSWQRRGVAA